MLLAIYKVCRDLFKISEGYFCTCRIMILVYRLSDYTGDLPCEFSELISVLPLEFFWIITLSDIPVFNN